MFTNERMIDEEIVASDIVYHFVSDIKSGVLNVDEVIDNNRYRNCLEVYGYKKYADNKLIKERVAWAVNGWVTLQWKFGSNFKNSKTLAYKIAKGFIDNINPNRRYTYSQVCDFVMGCFGELDTELVGKVSKLVDYMFCEKGKGPLFGYDEEYDKVIL